MEREMLAKRNELTMPIENGFLPYDSQTVERFQDAMKVLTMNRGFSQPTEELMEVAYAFLCLDGSITNRLIITDPKEEERIQERYMSAGDRFIRLYDQLLEKSDSLGREYIKVREELIAKEGFFKYPEDTLYGKLQRPWGFDELPEDFRFVDNPTVEDFPIYIVQNMPAWLIKTAHGDNLSSEMTLANQDAFLKVAEAGAVRAKYFAVNLLYKLMDNLAVICENMINNCARSEQVIAMLDVFRQPLEDYVCKKHADKTGYHFPGVLEEIKDVRVLCKAPLSTVLYESLKIRNRSKVCDPDELTETAKNEIQDRLRFYNTSTTRQDKIFTNFRWKK